MRFSGSVLSSFILFVSSFSPFGRVLSQIVATFLGLSKCGVTIAECAHVHSFVQSAWNVYNLPRTAAAEISTELDESWMCVCLSLKLLQSLVSLSRFLLALGKFSAGKVERRVCVVYSRWLRQYFCSRVDGLVPAASRRILFTCPWCLFGFCPCPRKSPLSQDGSSL